MYVKPPLYIEQQYVFIFSFQCFSSDILDRILYLNLKFHLLSPTADSQQKLASQESSNLLRCIPHQILNILMYYKLNFVAICCGMNNS